ncbi:unnamed protein product [Linum trigynum]|uniref:Uncharacterized protein n=1 Tax=Linum trigynum TaxID=586398 RepID=A0AAV2F5J2_9ROSI
MHFGSMTMMARPPRRGKLTAPKTGTASQAPTKPGPSASVAALPKSLIPLSKPPTATSQTTLASGAGGLMTVQASAETTHKVRDVGKWIAESPADEHDEGRKKTKETSLTETVDFSPHSSLREDCARRMLHELSGKLLVPPEYTEAEDPSTRYWVGTAAHFLLAAGVGLSQIGMTNEKLHMANLRGEMEAEKLRKWIGKLEVESLKGRAMFRAEAKAELEKEHADTIKDLRADLSRGVQKVNSLMADKEILEADVTRLREPVDEMEKAQAESVLRHKTEVDDAAKAAVASYLLSPAFRKIDDAKSSKVIADTVASIRHLFRREHPELEWDIDAMWDAVVAWGSSEGDVNSENDLTVLAGGDEASSRGGGNS